MWNVSVTKVAIEAVAGFDYFILNSAQEASLLCIVDSAWEFIYVHNHVFNLVKTTDKSLSVVIILR